MLTGILRLRAAISTVLSKKELHKHRNMDQNDHEIKKIKSVVKVLEPFYITTEKISGEKYAISSLILPSCYYLYNRVKKIYFLSRNLKN